MDIMSDYHLDRLIAQELGVKEFGFLTKEKGEIFVCGWIGDEYFQHKSWLASILSSPNIEQRVKEALEEALKLILYYDGTGRTPLVRAIDKLIADER